MILVIIKQEKKNLKQLRTLVVLMALHEVKKIGK